MIDKIITSMFHGNLKTKIFLWSILIMALAAVGLFVAAMALGAPAFGIGGVFMAISGLVTSQSVSLKDTASGKKNKREKEVESQGKAARENIEKKEKEEVDDSSIEPTEKEREHAKARYLASMNEKKVKKLLKEHKVNQSHVKVMIDSYPKRGLKQAPAFMWRTEKKLHFLVLEGKANEFEVPLDKIKGIFYEKNVAANPEEDYPTFRYATFISKLFSPYLPEYREVTKNGELTYVKNRFRIIPGISFTNSSMANVMSILKNIPFLVDDDVCRSVLFDEYFKEVYRNSILCKNLVIDLDTFRELVEKTLQALINAPITSREFVQSMKNMRHYRLVTNEQVAKYTQLYQQKMAGKKVE